MSIKRILLPLPEFANHAGEIDMALAAAKALGAHVEALLITEPQHRQSVAYQASAAATEIRTEW
jgi:hypothetical protein